MTDNHSNTDASGGRDTMISRTTAQPPEPLNAVFEALCNERRRYLLYYLNRQPRKVAEFDELVEYVTVLETAGNPDDGARKHVEASLHHIHLPKLADLGFIEYDARSQTVRRWGYPSFDEWLEHAEYMELE